jgi:hypothetical protein
MDGGAHPGALTGALTGAPNRALNGAPMTAAQCGFGGSSLRSSESSSSKSSGRWKSL